MKRFLILLLIPICSTGFLSLDRSADHTAKGKVLSENAPIPFARVRIPASDNYVVTDNNGEFEINLPDHSDSLVITAAAKGYYNGAAKVSSSGRSITINLHKLFEKDNRDYKWTNPEINPESRGNCGNCHPKMLNEEWARSSHANSAANPYFLAMYYGKDTTLMRKAGPGYKIDFPGSKGNCANCHIPGAAVNSPSGIDPLSVADVSNYGVFCDVCHKIADVRQPKNEAETGTSSISFLRPPEGRSIFFGPYDDVPEPDTYSPLTRKSEFCGPCHTAKSGDVRIYNSYNEWKNSPYPASGIQCQTCHMAPDGVTTNFAPGKGGLERDPSTIPTHLFPGPRDPKFMANSLSMNFSVEKKSDSIRVRVTLYNDKTGHDIPSGSPSRNMILLVECVNEKGDNLKFIDGQTVPSWGGKGKKSEGNFANLPGKGFAKILEDSEGNYPAPDWKAVNILSDSRLAPFDKDISYYYFKAPAESSKIKIRTRLVYRRFFKETMQEKGFALNDIIMESDSLEFKAGNQ
jgi:hypothetical protein